MKLTNNIKSTIRIAKIELNSMFYSPVAWLVLVIFAIQVGYGFATPMARQLHTADIHPGNLWNVSDAIFTAFMTGFIPGLLRTLFIYVPLLTMGLMSREYYSGSIKLLYSSPIRNSSIILGKYLAMMLYGLILMMIIGIFVLFSAFVIKDFELGRILTAMLGLYLLFLSYVAIGLFLSSITKYQVVAAISTFAVLAFLNYIGGVGQDIDFIRDITYWLSINGRSGDFINGLISSEHIAYYLLIIAFCLSLSIFKLNTEKVIMSTKVKVMKYLLIVVVTIGLGVLLSSPHMRVYYDATNIKENTLAIESQEIINAIDGDLTITTYVNALSQDVHKGLPRGKKDDEKFFEKYSRFKPELKFKYVYYWDKTYNPYMESRYKGLTDEEKARRFCVSEKLNFDMFMPPSEIKEYAKKANVDLAAEKNRFIRVIERGNGQKAIMRVYNDSERHPSEAEISSAMKRFISPSPMVGFATGYKAREMDNYGDRGYYLFAYDKYTRQSLLNQGFDTKPVDLDKDDLADIDILVLADMRDSLSQAALANIQKYIAKGGNLFILGDYGRTEVMNKITEPMGVKYLDGVIATENPYSSPSVLFAYYAPESPKTFPAYIKLQRYNWRVAMPTCVALDYSGVKDFAVKEVLFSPEKSWIEYETTDFVDGKFVCNPEAGEVKGSHPTLIALERKVGTKEQRILISGDADMIANQELTMERSDASKSNLTVISGSFRWLSENQYPVNVTKPDQTDNEIYMPKGMGKWVKFISYGIFPLLLIVLGAFIILKRQRK